MRWRATVVVKLELPEPRAPERLEHEIQQSLAIRTRRARVDVSKIRYAKGIRPPQSSANDQLAFLRINGCTRSLNGAGPDVAGLIRGVRSDLGASAAEVLIWVARPRGPRRLLHRAVAGSSMPGDPGTGGPGTAGVREPRRPFPPGFPPMQAALDPPVR